MEKTLKQNEIDALFEAARSTAPDDKRPEARARVDHANLRALLFAQGYPATAFTGD